MVDGREGGGEKGSSRRSLAKRARKGGGVRRYTGGLRERGEEDERLPSMNHDTEADLEAQKLPL